MTGAYKIVDFSGGMNTVQSEYMIPLKDSVLLRNMTVEGNRIVTLPGFTKYYETEDKGPVQGGATDGKAQAWIQGNKLYYYDDGNKELGTLADAVGVGVLGNKSTNEDYNIFMYKEYIIVTNSLKSGRSTLNCEGERPRAFKFTSQGGCIQGCKTITEAELSIEPLECLDGIYAPTVSIVYNGVLYFGGGPSGSDYRNRINWGGVERLEVVSPLDQSILSRSYLFNFCRELPDYEDASKLGNFITNYQFVGDGEPITSFFTNGNSLYIGKRNSIHKAAQSFSVGNITGNTSIDSNFSTIDIALTHQISQATATGIKNQEVVHNVHGNTIYYDGTHVRRLEYDTSNQTLKDITLSYPMREYIKSIPNDQRYATSLYTYPFIKFFLRDDGKQTGDNVAMVYNIETDSWSLQDNILISHAWSGYDERSDAWQGFWGSEFQNLIYKDNVGTTWGDEPRDFEWVGPMMNFGDCSSYKNLSQLNICTKVGLDTEISLSIDTLSTKQNNMIKHIGKEYPLISPSKIKSPTTATGRFGISQFGSTRNRKEVVDKIGNNNTTVKTHILNRQGFQPHIRGTGYGEFEIEYLDLYIEPTLIRNYTT